MDDSWFNEHDEWIEQLREFLNANLDEEVDEPTLIFLSNLAAQLRRGDLTMREAAERIRHWGNKLYGMVHLPDNDAFELEMEVGDLVEITEDFKTYMEVCEQPGIANGIIRIFAHPDFGDEAVSTEHAGKVAVGFHAKKWLNLERFSSDEMKAINWSIARALSQHAETN